MDEYLFFQANKKQLKENESIISRKIFKTDKKDENYQSEVSSTTSSRLGLNSRLSKAGRMIMNSAQQKKRGENVQLPPAKPTRKVLGENDQNTIGEAHVFTNELSCDTMDNCLKLLSTNYTEQYASSGFPPKICTLMLKELSKTKQNQLKMKILDIGCGKGCAGEYLRQDGFSNITGIDCSKNLLQIAESKKAYSKLEKVAIGETEISDFHSEKYDFVISSSMINNDGWDEQIFHQMLGCLKKNGILIFATKLNLTQENQYGEEMTKLSDQQYWKFLTEHTFYRYDKIAEQKGRFSNKKVKIVAYQKTDHNVWVEEQRIKKEQDEKVRAEKQKIIDARDKARDDKLNGAQKRKQDREQLKKQMTVKQIEEEKKAVEEAKAAEIEAAKQAEIKEKEKQKMMEEVKLRMKEAMWKQLKAHQAAEVARIEAKRSEILKKQQGPKKERPGFNAGA